MRWFSAFGSIVLAGALAACTHHGAGPSPVPTTSGSPGPPSLLAYVANFNGNTVTAYRPLQSTPAQTISTGVSGPIALAVDASGNLFVDNCPACIGNAGTTQSITEYPRGQTAPTRTITVGLNHPFAIAVDDKGNLYVANNGGSNVTVYAPGATSPSRTIAAGVSSPDAVAVDTSGNVYVGNAPSGANGVTVYGSNGNLVRSMSVTGIESVALDASGNLYVSSCSASCGLGSASDSVVVFASGTSNVKYRIVGGVSFPTYMAFDGSGNLYVANDVSGSLNNVAEFAAGTTTPIKSIAAPGPTGIAIDKKGVVYVSNGIGPSGSQYNSMTEYNGSILTVTAGIDGAAAVATSTTP